jgi:hypothetical protein
MEYMMIFIECLSMNHAEYSITINKMSTDTLKALLK